MFEFQVSRLFIPESSHLIISEDYERITDSVNSGLKTGALRENLQSYQRPSKIWLSAVIGSKNISNKMYWEIIYYMSSSVFP
jgi:hypothetical protein